MEEKRIGVVTHYYSHLGVGIIKIEADGLKVGDTVRFKGHTTDFQQTVDSMQIEHRDVQEAKPKDLVGLKTSEHVREHDEVLKVMD
jgi:translation elongation factor EF-1alpha